MKWSLCILFIFSCLTTIAQKSFEDRFNALQQVKLDSGVTLTFDEPKVLFASKPTKLILFALPNGNTTAQSFGKKLAQGEDWHYDIQHIGAQTEFIRQTDQKTNYIVVYIENELKSWPAWRRKATGRDQQIATIVELIHQKYANFKPKLTLTCHSGGGSFIFGYLNSQPQIPAIIERIGFLDATYGYETEKHATKLNSWLKSKKNSLQVIAYNDSVVVYNGKPLVSPTGGTWYRSRLMASDLKLKQQGLADRLWYMQPPNISFQLIKNPEAKIFHTVLVEKNGFIDLLFHQTRFQDKGYRFWEDRAYQALILE